MFKNIGGDNLQNVGRDFMVVLGRTKCGMNGTGFKAVESSPYYGYCRLAGFSGSMT